MTTTLSVRAFWLGNEIAFDPIAKHFGISRRSRWEELLALESPNLAGVLADPASKRVHLFPFGCIVTFGMAHHEVADLIGYLRKIEPRLQDPSDAFQDDCQLEVGTGALQIRDDRIGVPSLDDWVPGILSTVLSKSVALDRVESEIERLLDEAEPVVQNLMLAKVSPSDRKISSLAGRILSFRLDTVAYIQLLDKPDATWDNPDAEALYAKLAQFFELHDRYDKIQAKSEVLMDLTEVVTTYAHHHRGARLEWRSSSSSSSRSSSRSSRCSCTELARLGRHGSVIGAKRESYRRLRMRRTCSRTRRFTRSVSTKAKAISTRFTACRPSNQGSIAGMHWSQEMRSSQTGWGSRGFFQRTVVVAVSRSPSGNGRFQRMLLPDESMRPRLSVATMVPGTRQTMCVKSPSSLEPGGSLMVRRNRVPESVSSRRMPPNNASTGRMVLSGRRASTESKWTVPPIQRRLPAPESMPEIHCTPLSRLTAYLTSATREGSTLSRGIPIAIRTSPEPSGWITPVSS